MREEAKAKNEKDIRKKLNEKIQRTITKDKKQ